VTFTELPQFAAWQHRDARRGFEVAFFRPADEEVRIEGETVAVEGAEAWAVRYSIELDAGWRTLAAHVTGVSAAGRHAVAIRTDAAGRWEVDGRRAPELDGCMDVDLESSALTNAFPAHRLGLAVGDVADAPAAYVRAADLGVEGLEQRYLRLEDVSGRQRYRYTAPAFEFECELVYDESGLLIDYPGIAVRAG
jgi:uncharacterized protein